MGVNVTAKANDPSTIFRIWVYFRTGWSTYFTLIFSSANVLVTTYFLAIDKIPTLQQIFPTFTHYVIITVTIGMPSLVFAGYVHFKKTSAFKAESDIRIESQPHQYRILKNTELILATIYRLNKLLVKKLNNEKLSDSELNEMNKLKNAIIVHKNTRTISNPILIEIDHIIQFGENNDRS